MAKDIIQIAVLGAGTVGSGVYEMIQENGAELAKRTGAKLNIKKVLVRDASKERPGYDPEILTDNWQEIISDESIEIVVEVMGGIHPAKEYLNP